MNVIDLFSGVGGFSLGFERAGMKTVAFCESNPFCRRVLAKHWPGVMIYEDIKDISGQRLWDDGITISIQVLCGGFPCQDISNAGKRAGIDGERSGLWSQFARIIGDIRPHYVIVENVSALLGRGLGRVLGDLAALGFDAEWACFSTGLSFGHKRDRIFIVAYPAKQGPPQRRNAGTNSENALDIWTRQRFASVLAPVDAAQKWTDRPLLGRGVSRISKRVDRIGAIGNAVIPQIAEIIGRAIMNKSLAFSYQKVHKEKALVVSQRLNQL